MTDFYLISNNQERFKGCLVLPAQECTILSLELLSEWDESYGPPLQEVCISLYTQHFPDNFNGFRGPLEMYPCTLGDLCSRKY